MKSKMLLGIILVIVGVVVLGYQGITYTTRKDVLDIGPIHATKDEHHTIPLPPILGVVALAGGIVLMVTGERRAAQ